MISLPIDPLLPSLIETVRASLNTILTATPGAGKTTRLPAALLTAVRGKILVLEPRRMATVSACLRVCEERQWVAGGPEVGYQVRFESKVGRDTRLIYMTDALLLRRMLDDSELAGVDLVVIDEFHERNLHQDLILGAVRELQEMGRDLKLLVMSATLDTDRLRRFLPKASVVDVPGQVFPLDVRYAEQSLRPQTDAPFFQRVVEVSTAAARETAGDVLVFLPGVGEILKIAERLQSISTREIVVLHGSLPLAEQQRALRAPTRPRIILTTNVAEASVTVQGVDYVVDCGLAKVMEMNPRTGFSTLMLERISLFNAQQRAGRAAREKPGVCVRLWTPFEEATLALEPVPECQRTDLSFALLWLAQFGVSDFNAFSWFDLPNGKLMTWAVAGLKALGALDAHQRLTDFGRRLLRYPLPPRLGALLAKGEEMGIGSTAARLAAILADRDFASALDIHSQDECDLLLRLELLRESRSRGAQTVLESSRQLERLVAKGEGDATDVKRLLLLTQQDRLCRRRGQSERAVMVGGRGVRLHPQSQVRKSEFFVALQGLDLEGQADTSVTLACGFDKSFLLQNLKERIQTDEDVYFDEEKKQFYSRRVRRLEDLAIEEPSLGPVSPEQVEAAMVETLMARWEWLASQNEALAEWLERLRFLQAHDARFFLRDEDIRQVVEMAAFGCSKISEVVARDFVGFLETAVEPELLRALKEQVPARFEAPSGVSHKIQYGELHSAYVEVRLQEIFGLLQTPRLAFGQKPLTFRLLGPNYRPVQVTSDLENFWRTGYVEVRKELRARYPKHSWPDDPLTARPEAKGRRGT